MKPSEWIHKEAERQLPIVSKERGDYHTNPAWTEARLEAVMAYLDSQEPCKCGGPWPHIIANRDEPGNFCKHKEQCYECGEPLEGSHDGPALCEECGGN